MVGYYGQYKHTFSSSECIYFYNHIIYSVFINFEPDKIYMHIDIYYKEHTNNTGTWMKGIVFNFENCDLYLHFTLH